MVRPIHITYSQAKAKLSWRGCIDALIDGHKLPRAQMGDLFLENAPNTLLNRAAFISGFGYGTKVVTVFPNNAAMGKPSVQGAMFVFSADSGALEAIIDSRIITEVKTAADSLLGARLLARPDSENLLIIGAGVVARSLIEAYSASFPRLKQISVWARRAAAATQLVESLPDLGVARKVSFDLQQSVAEADIVAAATMAKKPLIFGAWVSAGTHIDLVGAFKQDMREADDDLLAKSRVFVDSRETTIDHIGEISIPLSTGSLKIDDIKGDLYDLVNHKVQARTSDAAVTLFKNGGGAHLDLMIARHILTLVGKG